MKVALAKTAEEGGYYLRQTKNYKPTVLQKANVSGRLDIHTCLRLQQDLLKLQND
jgi:hypothetical protein